MTVETEVANLTTAVDNLTSAVNVSKATLDASVADAEAAQSAAAASASTASGHATSAAASASAAAATASGLAGFDLAAIAATKAVTAIDVFVYDTSKDSDGGAWRKRTQHTSWYNETLNTATRGSRREFPAVAVIVAEADKVTIYDGDDPSLPMWMVFSGNYQSAVYNVGGLKTVSMLNGIMATGASDGSSLGAYSAVSFLADKAETRRGGGYGTFKGNISQRTQSLGHAGDEVALVNNLINDVDMTVLPNAPIDPATGLPVPTIVIGTNSGISVIHNDGTVVDGTFSVVGNYVNYVAFLDDERMIALHSNTSGVKGWHASFFDIPAADIATLGSNNKVYSNTSVPPVGLVNYEDKSGVQAYAGGFALGHKGEQYGRGALSLVAENPIDKTKGMVARATSTYNTGWMNGDIKGAFLSDTDDTDLVGSGELVTNGDFATNDLTGWTDISLGTGSADASSGAAQLQGTDSSNRAWINTSFSTVAGKPYVVTFEITADAGGLTSLGVGPTSSSVATIDYGVSAVGVYTRTFVATTSTTHVNFRTTAVTDMTVDNVSVKLADADRSVNNKGLIVNGTVNRSAVATGAELVGYSNFSPSNYLEQPYNSDLDFGTSDFFACAWINTSGTSDCIFERGTDPYSAGRIQFTVNTLGQLRLILSGEISGTNTLETSEAVNSGTWRLAACGVQDGVAKVWVDGVLKVSETVTATGGLSNANASVRIGLFQNGGSSFAGDMALLRISGTAPTEEQIKKIYEDEKFLFQENAACTLYGSDAVTALAHDSDTGLLHVGTSAGRSVFQGLRRVSNTTTAVGTAISASNGLVVEE